MTWWCVGDHLWVVRTQHLSADERLPTSHWFTPHLIYPGSTSKSLTHSRIPLSLCNLIFFMWINEGRRNTTMISSWTKWYYKARLSSVVSTGFSVILLPMCVKLFHVMFVCLFLPSVLFQIISLCFILLLNSHFLPRSNFFVWLGLVLNVNYIRLWC